MWDAAGVLPAADQLRAIRVDAVDVAGRKEDDVKNGMSIAVLSVAVLAAGAAIAQAEPVLQGKDA